MKPVPFAQFAAITALALTPAQAAHDAVVYDGLDPADLAPPAREIAAALFGAVDRIPSCARAVSVQVKGRDVGGSRRGALRLLQLALTLPLDRLDRDEIAFCLFGAPKLRLARVALRFALAAARRVPGVSIVAEWRDGFTVQRHDGRLVTLECFAASRAGDTGRSVPLIAALLDESAFYRDESTGVVNDRAVFNALVPRLLPGGQILIVSSPWAESGLLYDEFRANHGAPRTALASLCPTLLMRDDDETRATVERERERDPENARREFDAEFLPAGSGQFFDSTAITAAVAELPNPLTPIAGARVGFGVDPAFRSDSFAAVVVRRDKEGIFEAAECFERRPQKGSPLVPSAVMAEACAVGKRHGAREICTDSYYLEAVREHAQRNGFGLNVAPEGQKGKAMIYLAARELLHAGKVRIPAGMRELIRQLREVVSKPTPGGGISISSPRRGGMHGDLVSAFVLALWRSEQVSRGGGRRLIKVRTGSGWTDESGGVGGW